ncbi:hypothetical protein GPDM_06690 [Planococcus donghaensis MPA1U2]|uniref:Uncharacterized protein n=1 Tax=Planococcus donghaensis MPA1U2 TaxID=933115 RepID=E7RFU0_9BACL|nr:hypothetical protein GPDM_06690 [Planococcus donghaensis MPA1U2]
MIILLSIYLSKAFVIDNGLIAYYKSYHFLRFRIIALYSSSLHITGYENFYKIKGDANSQHLPLLYVRLPIIRYM